MSVAAPARRAPPRRLARTLRRRGRCSPSCAAACATSGARRWPGAAALGRDVRPVGGDVAVDRGLDRRADAELPGGAQGGVRHRGARLGRGVRRRRDAQLHRAARVAFFAIRVRRAPIAAAEERGYLDTLLAAPLSRRDLVAGTVHRRRLVVAGVLAVVALMTWIAGACRRRGSLARARSRAAWRTSGRWPWSSRGSPRSPPACCTGPRRCTAVAVGTLVAMYVSTSSEAGRRRSSRSAPCRLPLLRHGDPGRHRPARLRRTDARGRRCSRSPAPALRPPRRALGGNAMTLVWFVIWLIANTLGGSEPLVLDPVNAWAATLILAAALDFAQPFKPGGG